MSKAIILGIIAGTLLSSAAIYAEDNADPTVSVKFSQNMVEALKGVGGNVKYTEYDKVGHDAWTMTYSNQEVLKWLFDQRKNKLSSTQ